MANTISEQEASKRRRVINSALKGILTNKEILQAIDIWEKNFYNSPTLRIPSFIGKAQKELNFSDEVRKSLLRSLNKSLASPLESLEPDPYQKQTSTEKKPVGKYSVFNFLLTTLLTNLGDGEIKILQEDLHANLSNANLSVASKQDLNKWFTSIATSNVKQITSNLKLAEMSEILDMLYNSFCEILGPMKTDQAFAQALRDAEKLPEARNFPPKQLF